jgi:microcystin-dependent protein
MLMDAFIGEIRTFCFGFEPQDWLICDGRTFSVSDYQALFSIIGYTYGGSGTKFMIPKIPGRVLVGAGQRPGADYYPLGLAYGLESVILFENNMPGHSHVFKGAQTTTSPAATVVKEPTPSCYLSNVAAKQTPPVQGFAYSPNVTDYSELSNGVVGPPQILEPHNNMQPYQGFNYCICAFSDYYPIRP